MFALICARIGKSDRIQKGNAGPKVCDLCDIGSKQLIWVNYLRWEVQGDTAYGNLLPHLGSSAFQTVLCKGAITDSAHLHPLHRVAECVDRHMMFIATEVRTVLVYSRLSGI